MTQTVTPVFIVGVVALIVALFFFIVTFTEHTEPPLVYTPAQRHDERCTADGTPYTIIVDGLKVPWDITFRPDGDLYATERGGTLSQIFSSGGRVEIRALMRVRACGVCTSQFGVKWGC